MEAFVDTILILAGNADALLTLAMAVVVVASLIVSGTRTPDPETPLGKAYRVLEWLALTFGRAKDTGASPPAAGQSGPAAR
jgi:hypothetical protein